MRPELRRLIIKRMKNDYRDFADMNYGEDARDYNDMRDYGYGEHDYETGRNRDTRRGVRGSGRRRRDRADDMYDDDEEYEKLQLPRKLKMAWKRRLINTDGTKGAHFSNEELYEPIEKMRLSFDDYTESDVCLVANMLYSDYGKTLKHVIPPDKEAYYYVALAKDFLEDDDAGVEGSEKVTSYYHFIVNG